MWILAHNTQLPILENDWTLVFSTQSMLWKELRPITTVAINFQAISLFLCPIYDVSRGYCFNSTSHDLNQIWVLSVTRNAKFVRSRVLGNRTISKIYPKQIGVGFEKFRLATIVSRPQSENIR